MIEVSDKEQTNSTESSISDSVSKGAASEVSGTSATGGEQEAAVKAVQTEASSSATDSSVAAASTGMDSSVAAASTGLDSSVAAVTDTAEKETEDIIFTEKRIPVTVYYQDGDGYLIPMTRWIQFQQGMGRVAVSLCIDSAIAREEVAYYGVYPVIPEKTEVQGIDIRDGIATIDFNRHLLNYSDKEAERNIIASIIYMLTEFKTIDKVRILINGYRQEVLKYGTDVSEALGREDIMINTDAFLPETGSDKVDVFLFKKANEGFTYIVPVSVKETEMADSEPEMLVKQLLGVSAYGSLFNEIPEGVELLKYSTKFDVLTLDFSEEITEYGGNAREEGILKQLAYTVRQLDGIKRLKILVEGQKAELPEGTDISSGLAIPATINDVMDR